MTRVLLAEDDTSISEPLSRALRREGYEVDVTADGPTTLDRALSDGVDLILLDIGLPELDGLEVCRRVRAGGYAVPVLILTARADEVDTVVGLDAGADDYVTKPFRLAELLARGRAPLPPGPAAPGHGGGLGRARRADRPGCSPGLARGHRARPHHQGVRPALDPAQGRGQGGHPRADHARGLGCEMVDLHQDARHAHLLAAPQARRRRAQPQVHHHGPGRGVPL